ncbi:MAG: tRNA (adenosine(37)-N6)-threonylcarbamoyltransferase complex dimerization subunit type 1 TsaB [Coriobacteriia bacterium]|nr:tRNA (adenosine(37)-N6)-threonylcarbamoyltransferase complex dimerization subunit type 1 TsaB [Coriobacteriia bacterium]
MSAVVLALDTATEQIALALGVFEGEGEAEALRVLATRDVLAPREALSSTLPLLREIFDESGLTAAQIDSVVVGRGPGSFTGVRIGVSIAKGIAHGLGVPLFGVGTLDAIAWGIAMQHEQPLVVGIIGDAMRGEVYPALFEISPDAVRRRAPDTVGAPTAIAMEWAGSSEPLLLAGNGLRKYADIFVSAAADGVLSIAEERFWAPSGEGLLRAFAAARLSGETGDGDPVTLLPIYTRLSDAEENEQRLAGTTSATVPSSGVSDREGGQR